MVFGRFYGQPVPLPIIPTIARNAPISKRLNATMAFNPTIVILGNISLYDESVKELMLKSGSYLAAYATLNIPVARLL